MNDTIKKYLLQSTMIAGLVTAGFAAPVYAQDNDDFDPIIETTDSADEDEEIDQIVVTGSRIRRTVGDAPVPLTVIDQDQADISGFNNIADFLSDIPALQGSQVPDDTTGAVLNAAGLNLLSLRNLGAQRTLVLINGQRQVASQNASAAVDVGSIPFIALERTEVLTGGASSLYGADAVSGVVNFILTDEHEGIELDASYAEDRNGFNDGLRLSGIIGQNFDEDKGNAYVAVEYRRNDELLNRQVDFLEENRFLARIDNDFDDDGDGIREPDGLPNFALFDNGTLDIINDAGVVSFFDTTVGAFTPQFTFDQSGNTIPFTQGVNPRTGDGAAGPGTPINSNTRVSGDGTTLNGLSESLTPASDTVNLLARVNYEVFEDTSFYLDGRYSRTEATTSFQPSFFSGIATGIGIANADRTLNTPFGIDTFTATDNVFLDDEFGDLVAANFGIGLVQRFQAEFNRSQEATRELFRIVGGFKGEFTSPLDESQNWLWDVNANFGRTEATNRQLNVRLNDNFAAGADAIEINQDDLDQIALVDPLSTRFQVGDVVCRVQFLEEAGLSTALAGGIGQVQQQTIDECVPFSLFGDGAISPEALDFIAVDLNDRFQQEQIQFTANVTGDLWDLWGAGPTLFAGGVEYREERSESNPDELPLQRNTFANVIQPTTGSFDVYEIYGELELPILTDLPFAKSLSATGSFRYSDYSTIGGTETFAIRGEWEPYEDLSFRGGFSRAIRAPNIGELFQAPAQTFVNINDPCDIINIFNGPASRPANCAAIGVPVGFDRDATTANSRNISVSGTNAGNPDVLEETSESYFAGLTFSPDFFPGFILAVDWFDIEIEDAIAGLGIGNILNNCVDGVVPDENFCSLITRNAAGEVIDFLNAPVNIGSFGSEGVDFQAVYSRDIGDIINSSDELGSIQLNLQGTRLISQTTQTDPLDDTTFSELRNFVGLPELRFNFSATYAYDDIAFTYGLNWVNSQDVFDRRNNLFDPATGNGVVLDSLEDIPSEFLTTGSFAEHDLSVRYNIADTVGLRAGVVNLFDNDPPGFAENNIFDFFGRRYFAGVNVQF